MKLFLIVLGGRTSKSNIYVLDVRCDIGNKIEDTIPTLRKEWFGLKKGLHIDSFMEIKYIDGFKIKIRKKKIQTHENFEIPNKFILLIF